MKLKLILSPEGCLLDVVAADTGDRIDGVFDASQYHGLNSGVGTVTLSLHAHKVVLEVRGLPKRES